MKKKLPTINDEKISDSRYFSRHIDGYNPVEDNCGKRDFFLVILQNIGEQAPPPLEQPELVGRYD